MSLEFIIITMISLILIITWIFFDISKQKTEVNYIRILVFVSIFFLMIALFSPLLIFIRFSVGDNFSATQLGPIGDFLAGSTVPFLTTGSILLLLATILMQREEVKISQEGIKQLNNQTLIVKKQYEETRKETILTNKTLKKQQFETTFFNMISLHHTIVNNMNFKESTGRSVFENMFYYLENTTIKDVIKEKWQDYLFNMLNTNNGKEFRYANILSEEFEEKRKALFIDLKISKRGIPLTDDNIQEVYSEIGKEYSKDKEHYFLEFSKLLNEIDISNPPIKNIILIEFKHILVEKPNESLKREVYERVFKEYGNTVGHYYRNLYRIFRFIEEEDFDNFNENDVKEKNKYRGILRAQLSSQELIMLFYNISYSNKGEKFKEILRNKNFFDDHLDFEKFLWGNDEEELSRIG